MTARHTAGTGCPAISYGERLAAAVGTHGRLCVGIDPHPVLLGQWGLSADATGLRQFGLRVVEAAVGRVGVVKPQVAFFERCGPSGMEALADVQRAARQAGLLVIADAKRGDIGSTMAAYAEAWLHPGSELAADALTVSPYLGFGSLQPAVEAAAHHGAGLYVLTLTSNPEGADVQLARRGDRPVAGLVAAQAAAASHSAGFGDVGLVVGATTAHLAAHEGIDLTDGRPSLLAPGYGAQGATAAQMRSSFGPAWDQVLVNASRSVLSQGPGVADLGRAITAAQRDL